MRISETQKTALHREQSCRIYPRITIASSAAQINRAFIPVMMIPAQLTNNAKQATRHRQVACYNLLLINKVY